MRVLHFAYEEAERTGATILAEGVETKRHDEVVRALGTRWRRGGSTGSQPTIPRPPDITRPICRSGPSWD